MYSLRFSVIITLLLTILTAISYGNLDLKIDVEKLTYPKAEDVNNFTKETEKLTVSLGHYYLSSATPTTTTIYDFSKRRIYTIDANSRTFNDDSLFMEIGFRACEFQNRLKLSELLSSADIKDNPMDKVLSEHLFSLQAENNKTPLKRSQDKDEIIFSWKNQELFSYSKKCIDADPNYSKEFARFIRYYFGGHPQILTELEKNKKTPESIKAFRYDISKKIVLLKIISSKATLDTPYLLANLKKVPAADSDFSAIIPNTEPNLTKASQLRASSLITEANQAFSSKQYFNAMLTYLEYSLQIGAFPNQFNEQKTYFINDLNVKKLFFSLSDSSKEDPNGAIEILKSLRIDSKNKQYVLMIFEANLQLSIGNFHEAKSLFLKALEKNPYIAGAWKDLGDLYFAEYDTFSAWRCYDMARAINPTHKLMEQVNQFERKLVQEHPEFF